MGSTWATDGAGGFLGGTHVPLAHVANLTITLESGTGPGMCRGHDPGGVLSAKVGTGMFGPDRVHF